MDALFAFTYQLKSNIQLKHSIYAAFSHFCSIAVNNLGLVSSYIIISYLIIELECGNILIADIGKQRYENDRCSNRRRIDWQ